MSWMSKFEYSLLICDILFSISLNSQIVQDDQKMLYQAYFLVVDYFEIAFVKQIQILHKKCLS